MAPESLPQLEQQEARGQQTSLALRHALPASGSVLDLGPAQGGNVAFFASRGCKLFIADLRGTVFSNPPPSVRRDALALALDRDLPRGQSFDLVLLWDLLNYLDAAEIGMLGARLRSVCRASTIVYALISIRKNVPDRPGRYSVVDEGHIHYEVRSKLERPSPLLKEPELARLLPGFSVDSTYLLRNGMQEYLLQPRLEHPSQPPDHSASA